jgi:hypothetical protein
MFIYIHMILSYYKLFIYFNLGLSVMLDGLSHVHLHPYDPFLLQAVHLL